MTSRLELLPGGGRGGRRTLAETAAAELHQLILSGELPSGTPLRLVELANRLDMSQMPVREGLRRLEALGLVDIIPHKGAWVRELSLDDLRDTHETRLALESLAVRAAAEHFDQEDEQTAVSALAEHMRLSLADDSIGARQAHADFHFALYRAGGSQWLARAIEPVWQNSERYRFGSRQTAIQIERNRQEHQAILDACVARDPDAAEQALRNHLAGAVQRITETMTSKQQRETS
ncbi:DNA-binding GntR family transcriptional regulator [Kribbella sp. VKM Ac-2527]|uniref:DNA-binding GntR family transcriptional regulator n=1 Tax=Kribbella caucasensis TaxID=2512215 RepID=A0A4R6KII5_9ACTN|nr:GntR family transcriptional regulator [Kribbella sp. VKM Ac-2527]TDO50122.1 DNA-binding GntR family transcriptional regulator [Kribbella sp. VKM Ac-2527]